MDKKLKVTKESDTGMNMQFQDTRNGHIMSKTELISRLKSGNSAYNKDYFVNKTGDGKEYVSSKPDGSKKNNLDWEKSEGLWNMKPSD